MSAYPLVLSHPQIRRILDRKPRILILTRKPRTGTGPIELHDSLIVRRNAAHRKNGRSDLQEDPLVLTVEFETGRAVGLLELDLLIVRAAGYKTTEEFYLEWLQRRKRIKLEQEVHLCPFQVVSEVRYLAARVHRGYTTDPAQAVRDEPQALSRSELEEITREARARRQRELEALKAEIAERTEQLAEGASGADRRRLRNVRRAASSL